jgi:hypothetical protein
MFRLFVSRTAARRPRNAAPQLEELEQVLSLSAAIETDGHQLNAARRAVATLGSIDLGAADVSRSTENTTVARVEAPAYAWGSGDGVIVSRPTG